MTSLENLPEHLTELLPRLSIPPRPDHLQKSSELTVSDGELCWRRICDKIGRRYSGCRIKNFALHPEAKYRAVQNRVIDRLTEYGENIADRVKDGDGIVLFGPSGTGKDHLLVGLMYAACKANFAVQWVNGMDLFGDMRDAIDSQSREKDQVSEYVKPDVLVISDPVPPWGPLTQFQAAFLFRVIDARYRKCRPTWASANVIDGADASGRLGAQVVDRLRHGAVSLECSWPSYRAGW